jgi:cell division protein FtsX
MALSMVLLTAAGLLTRSITRLLAEDPGFEVERVAHLQIQWSRVRYADAASRLDAERRLEAWLEARPEVTGVAKASSLLQFGTAIQAEGSDVLADQPFTVPAVYASPDWFDVRGVHLVGGRPLDAGDAEADNVVIDRDMAEWIWGTEQVVGRRFRTDENEAWLTVVGVARELRLEGRDQRQGPNQIVYAAAPDQSPGVVTFSVRTEGDAAAVVPLMRRAVAAVDPAQWIWLAETAEQTLADHEDIPRFMLVLLNALASLSLVLAAAGLFAVLSYAVSRRKREMGIRVALGAGRARVRGMILAEGLRMSAVGVALGTALFLLAAGLFEGLVYGVGSRDLGSLVTAAVILTSVALAASFEPARAATRVDPREMLNAE